jgi:hypothetical protein
VAHGSGELQVPVPTSATWAAKESCLVFRSFPPKL